MARRKVARSPIESEILRHEKIMKLADKEIVAVESRCRIECAAARSRLERSKVIVKALRAGYAERGSCQ